VRWVCDNCGEQGRVSDDVPIDAVQCPTCGEPVLPAE
jgi:DNA-directed RNA polymerase subunit RPC12/RpoP